MCGYPLTGGTRAIDPVVLQTLREKYNATSPISFLSSYPLRIITEGSFGPSLFYKEWSVNDIIKASLPVSITGDVTTTISRAVHCADAARSNRPYRSQKARIPAW